MYVVTSNYTCAFCIPPCMSCNSSSYCHTCIAGYYRSAAGVCTNCPPGCLSCNTSSRCQSCDTGYFLDSGTRTCQKCSLLSANCRECTASVCLVCEMEYYMNSTSCAECSQLVPNCAICNSTSFCSVCFSGYYVTGLTSTASCAQC